MIVLDERIHVMNIDMEIQAHENIEFFHRYRGNMRVVEITTGVYIMVTVVRGQTSVFVRTNGTMYCQVIDKKDVAYDMVRSYYDNPMSQSQHFKFDGVRRSITKIRRVRTAAVPYRRTSKPPVPRFHRRVMGSILTINDQECAFMMVDGDTLASAVIGLKKIEENANTPHILQSYRETLAVIAMANLTPKLTDHA